MAIDHSLTYRSRSLKNIPHRLRLSEIFKQIDNFRLTRKPNTSYLDIGCSNGYITAQIKEKYSFSKVIGLDHNLENLDLARERYPSIEFGFIDLNSPAVTGLESFDLVTCFETLEHVGDLESALTNILERAKSQGSILITVPIEIKTVGILKFLAKTTIYKYKLEELPANPKWKSYLSALFSGEISKFREARSGWGTHFGFDYRLIDNILAKRNIPFTAKNFLTTRFYVIQK